MPSSPPKLAPKSANSVFWDLTRTPDVALRPHLAHEPELVRKLLFCDLHELNKVGPLPQMLSTVIEMIGDKRVIAPYEWMPYVLTDFHRYGHKMYVALMLRVNILEAYCKALRKEQTKELDKALEERERRAKQQRRVKRRQQRRGKMYPEEYSAKRRKHRSGDSSSSHSSAEEIEVTTEPIPPPPGDLPTQLDECSHYMHMWLDAHLLLCCAVESMKMCPVDGAHVTTALLNEYAPSGSTVFQEGDLPDLLAEVELCSFFSDNPTASSTKSSKSALKMPSSSELIADMLSKTIPHRCVVRDVIDKISTNCVMRDDVFFMLQGLLAASLLGIYRHARKRPSLRERLRIYNFFFFVPSDNNNVAKFIDDARAATGATVSRAELYVREHGLRPAETGTGGSYDGERRLKRIGPPRFRSVVHERKKIIFSWLTIATPNMKESQKRYLNQDTVVNIIREYIIFALQFIPHINQELCSRTDWVTWQHTVIDCLDAMRATAPTHTVLKAVSERGLPSKTLYQVEKDPFVDVLIRECGKFLDSGKRQQVALSCPDGSELPLDASFPEELDLVLRWMLREYPRTLAIMPVTRVPGPNATMEDVRRDFISQGKFPLRLLYGSNNAIREYCAGYANYERNPSPSSAAGLVSYLTRASMFQLQLIYAFAQALVDHTRMYAIPLSDHLAQQQAAVLRERIGAGSNDPLPRHLLTPFVCRRCRKFRSTVVSGKAEASSELPPFGSESVSFASSCLEMEVGERIRNRGGRIMSWDELVAEGKLHGTLFAWYKARAIADGEAMFYPADPTLFSATLEDVDYVRNWLEKLPPEPDIGAIMADETIPPLTMRHIPLNLPGPTDKMPRVFHEVDPDPAVDAVYEKRVVELREKPFIVGHWSADLADPTVIWTCASKRHKNEQRKTRQLWSSEQKVADAITPSDRDRAERTANHKRRHDMRSYYNYSLCSRTRLMEVNMLGYALRLHDTLYVACCSCLGYTTVADAHWWGSSLLCTRCWKRTTSPAVKSEGSMSSGYSRDSVGSTLIKCYQCKRRRKAGDVFFHTTVVDDHSMRFVTLYLCLNHSRRRSWLFHSPTYPLLSAVEAGIKSKWTTIKRWDPQKNYSTVTDNTSEMLEIERRLLRKAGKLVGTDIIDGPTIHTKKTAANDDTSDESSWDGENQLFSSGDDTDDEENQQLRRVRPAPIGINRRGQHATRAAPLIR